MTTTTPDSPRTLRLPAEWEPAAGVLLAWPHEGTDWAYMLDDIRRCYIDLAHAVARHAVAVIIAPDCSDARRALADIPADRILFCDIPTDDTWTRDYGVITTLDAAGNPILNDFGFNAWGGKFGHSRDNAVTAGLISRGLLHGSVRDLNHIILEGGSIESDGRGTILTTSHCLLTPTRNPQFNGKADVERMLADTLGARHVLWLDHGALEGDDTDGHIDTLARLAPDDTILYTAATHDGTPDSQTPALEEMHRQLREMRTPAGQPYNLIELPLPHPIYDEDGLRLPATYANFLVLNDAVVMPVYGQPRKDTLAEMTLRVAFPNHTIEKIDCRPLIRQHGSLHCATMQLLPGTLPI